jgi:2-polyprenyl-3-methyl-5-hydroxy-6-metoxy-1,4-benzoquinol methylase
MTPTADGDEVERRQHWSAVYTEKDTDEVSWFKASPSFSLAMLNAVGADPSMAVIDVGAGASRLAGALLERGFTDITALDVADDGLAAARSELGLDAGKITWLVADLLAWSPGRRYDVWHDRAVFHFLAAPAQQRRYLATAQAALRPGATMIIATFAEDGPEQCSGLPVARYSPAQLVDTLNAHGGATFELLEHRREEHRTPWGSIQPFTWCALAYSGQHATWPVKVVDTGRTEIA